jgi:DNA invertase Pin-like site-specific DNA recombinase
MQPTGDVTAGRLHHGANAIGYARVSTEEQAEDGYSLDVQTARIRAMAVAQGVTLAEVILDPGESAKSLNRPGMARLLALVDARAVDTVIIAKLDRLTRSLVDLAALLQRFDRRGVALVSVAETLDTGSAMGRMMLHFIVLLSQWEREVIGERTREALQYKRANWERVGTIPFGYRLAEDGVHLEADEDEQALVAQLRALRAQGRSLRQIADALNAAGWTTRRGTAWRFEYVARVLASALRMAKARLEPQQPRLFEEGRKHG